MTRTRRIAALAFVAAALPALAGCSMDRLGSAAIVDGEPISTEQLQDLTQEYLDVVPVNGSRSDTQRAVLQQLIVAKVFEEISRDLHVRVSDGRVARELDAVIKQVGGRGQLSRALAQQQVVPPSLQEQWMRNRLLFTAFARELDDSATSESGQPSEEALNRANRRLSRYAEKLDIEVNPRYGKWNPQAGIEPLVSGGLATPAEDLAEGKS